MKFVLTLVALVMLCPLCEAGPIRDRIKSRFGGCGTGLFHRSVTRSSNCASSVQTVTTQKSFQFQSQQFQVTPLQSPTPCINGCPCPNAQAPKIIQRK